jgi:hypothetical protein
VSRSAAAASSSARRVIAAVSDRVATGRSIGRQPFS